tara:strand:+ start:2296 stop:2703 length:408 start_codon:yes stop_codon:yes gene_type:complete
MKKITLIMLVAMVPLMTIAQKRSKKDKTDKNSTVSVEYMTIKGIEVPMNNEGVRSSSVDVRELALSKVSSEDMKLIVVFDYGDLRTAEVKEMKSARFRTMVSAVNAAANKGWEVINASVVLEDKMTVHYYHMQRR